MTGITRLRDDCSPSVPLVFDAGLPYEKFRSAGTAQAPDGSQPHGFVLYWRATMTTELISGRVPLT